MPIILKDRANNKNPGTNDNEIDEELGDLQLPVSITPRVSFSSNQPTSTTNVIQHQSLASSIQHNVVLHSNIDEQSTPTTNRYDLDTATNTDDKNDTKYPLNSLLTVYEQSSTNDLIADDSELLKSSKTASSVIEKITTDEKQTV